MMILVPAPYLPGDKQDANHVRVYHHHTQGLTGSSVRIYGPDHETVREVRCTSDLQRVKPYYSDGGTLLVHLKPLPVHRPRLYCRDIDMRVALNIVKERGRIPTRLEWLSTLYHSAAATEIGESNIGNRLFYRKEAAMHRKGLIENAPLSKFAPDNQVRLTAKGLCLLESLNA